VARTRIPLPTLLDKGSIPPPNKIILVGERITNTSIVSGSQLGIHVRYLTLNQPLKAPRDDDLLLLSIVP